MLFLVHLPVKGMESDRGVGNQLFLLGRARALKGEDPVPDLEAALESDWREGNSSVEQRIKTHVRLGNHHIEAGRPARAVEHFDDALDACELFSPGARQEGEWRERLSILRRDARLRTGR